MKRLTGNLKCLCSAKILLRFNLKKRSWRQDLFYLSLHCEIVIQANKYILKSTILKATMWGADIRKNGCDVCWPMFLKGFHQCCRLRTWANSFILLSSSSTNTIWIIQTPRAGKHECDRTAAQFLHPAAAAVEVWGLVNRGNHRSRLADASTFASSFQQKCH